ncbi:MAG TPA: HK97-gp10 family putative phage morphogenesis protein [Chloroflexota bacterium]|jgi:HK97 gp10 family phage protein|nr:HK97-gp10 family putative phage morphogenesis protein [Chloroflexota bacterium]
MARSASVKVVFNHLPKLRQALRPRAGAIVQAAALGIEADAKRRVPVRTGALRRSIHTVMTTPLSATVGPSAEYGAYVEFGTRSMPARPYLIPAAEAARGPFVAAMKKLFA